MAEQVPEWLRLQRKIFSRWVNQKLWISKHIKVEDIILSTQNDPTVLLSLAEVLSEKPFNGKLEKTAKMRVQKISNASTVLKYVYDDCGVQMKIRTSAEDLIDGNEKNVLGLVFAILQKFMKFGDEEEGHKSLSAKDSLLMWFQNKCQGYRDVEVTNFTTSFHSGLALCAIIHKHRPNLINYDSLDKANKVANLKTAMEAAERYFGLEQYLKPEDILKLDECGMLVYSSEYFYGIAEQRKIDQAVRRIHKVIKFTKTCDAMRAEYADSASKFKEHVAKVEKVLGDRTIDNTMAGARRRIEEFYSYKANDKSQIIGLQLNLDGLFTNLSVLLANNKRPPFTPPAGLAPKDIDATVHHLEVCEQERKVALHAELNRQIKLLKQDEHHQSLSAKLQAWIAAKDAYLARDDPIESVGAALLAIRTLEAFDKEHGAVAQGTVQALLALGKELKAGKYERSADVSGRETQISGDMARLAQLSAARRPVLDDALAREQRKEELRLEFANLAADLTRWGKDASEDLALALFGFTLEEVEAYSKQAAATEQRLRAELAEKRAACDAVTSEMEQLNCHDNAYTELTVADLDAAGAALEEALGAYRAAYEAELARQRANDALCKKFAGVAEPLAQWIAQTKEGITQARTPLREQLAAVDARIASVAADGKALPGIAALQREIDDAGVTNNRHTLLTAKDLEVQWQQYKDFLGKKKQVLEREIENEERRGISAEQFREIEENFRMFDKDKSNDIDQKELKACLYSLGEELSQHDVAKVMEEYGKGGKIVFDAVKKYMTHLFGDTDSKEEVLAGWNLVCRGEQIVKESHVKDVMEEEDRTYVKETAPKKGDGYDYVHWTNDVFSR